MFSSKFRVAEYDYQIKKCFKAEFKVREFNYNSEKRFKIATIDYESEKYHEINECNYCKFENNIKIRKNGYERCKEFNFNDTHDYRRSAHYR